MTTANNLLPDPPPALSIRFFGAMEVRVRGELLPRLRSRKSLWLLALLTLRYGRPVERMWLAATLWPDALQKQSFSNLAVVLSDLRKALGDQKGRIQSPTHQTILLDLNDSDDVDIVVFDAAIRKGDSSSLQKAVGLYGGRFLQGCPEEWVPQERQEREENCLRAIRTLAEAASLSRDHDAAHALWRRALEIDPLRDRARRGAMESLAALGDRNAALQVYREFSNLLSAEANSSPDKATTDLYQRLRSRLRALGTAPSGLATRSTGAALDGNSSGRQRSAGYLPQAITRIVGREDERVDVADGLRQARLMTLTGPGGIGKTRLAIEVAAEVAGRYVDGAWFVSFEALPTGSSSQVLAREIAGAFGLKEAPGQSLLGTITNYLRNRNVLLVLDNCEHVLAASAEVAAHLLRECAKVRVLATSREALGITGEAAWTVPALTVPDPAHLPQARLSFARIIAGFDSVQLFTERAQAADQNFAITGENAHEIARICVHLEGMPLAIELAAARTRAMTLEQIATRLQTHRGQLDVLTGGSRAVLSRQQTMRATLDWSYALLEERERLLLGRLSVFAGGCTLSAAEQVCADDSIPASQVLNLLESLVDKSLVRFVDPKETILPAIGGESGRYLLLEVVRQYAAERSGESDPADVVRARHRDWFLNFAEAAEPELLTSRSEETRRRLNEEYDNLRAVLSWCETKEPPGGLTGLRLTGALYRYWHERNEYREGRQYLERMLDRAGSTAEPFTRAKALAGLGIMAYSLNDYRAAQTAYDENLAFYRERGDARGIASTLAGLAYLAIGRGESLTARALLEECLTRYRELNSLTGIGRTLINLGNILKDQSDFDGARTRFEESLAIFRELADRRNIAWSLNHLGKIASIRCEYDSARALFEESLALFEELDDRRSAAVTNQCLGNLAGSLGDYESAQSRLELSAGIFKAIGDRRSMAGSLMNLCDAHGYLGNAALARKSGEESLNIFKDIGDRHGIAMALFSLGAVALRGGDPALAHARYAESLALSRDLGDLRFVAVNLDGLAGVALVLPRPDFQATAQLRRAAHALREQIGAPLPANEQAEYDRSVSQVRPAMGEGFFAIAREAGLAMSWQQAADYALEGAKTGICVSASGEVFPKSVI